MQLDMVSSPGPGSIISHYCYREIVSASLAFYCVSLFSRGIDRIRIAFVGYQASYLRATIR